MKHPDVEFLLPGSWRLLPVADEAAARRAIAGAAEHAVGRADDRARLRAEVRARFTAAADRARTAGGEAMWICDEIVPGVPLPASIVLYRPALAIGAAADAAGRRAALHRLLGPAGEDAGEADLVVAGQPAVRRATTASGPATDEPDAPVVTTVECEYWVAQPGGRILLLVMACAMPRLKDQLVQLFDLIAATVRPAAAESAAVVPPAQQPDGALR